MKKVLLAVAVVAALSFASCKVDDIVDTKTCVCTTIDTYEDGTENKNTEEYETLLSCSSYETSGTYGDYSYKTTCKEK